MVDKAPPPSSARGGQPGGGNGALIGVAIVLLLGAAGGILWWVTRNPAETKKVVTTASATATQITAPTSDLDLPPIDLPVDAGTPEDTGTDADAKPTPTGPAYVPCPAACSGQLTDAIKAAVNARAGTAKQCYKTALEGNEGLSGEIYVVVRVGQDGSTCSASIASDTTGNAKLQQCVRGKMVASYPAPKGGCVDVRVPIFFKPKT